MTTILEQEIAAQATVLASRAAAGAESAAAAVAAIARDDVDHVVIAARGSSDNAARFAQYLLGQESRLEVGLATPWLYRRPDAAPRLPRAAVVGISQSGRSPDIVAVLAAGRDQGRPTIAITNEPGSPLAAEADVVVPLLAGSERSVAATKTYLASLHAIVQIQQALGPDAGRARWLDRLPDLVATTATAALGARERFDVLADAPLITVAGRGLGYATACESALKLRELSGIPAEAFSPPDLMHGPIAAVGERVGVWLIAPGEREERDRVAGLLSRGGPSVVVGAAAELEANASVTFPLDPELPDWLASVLAVLPAQAAALRLAEKRGIDVDAPHGLSKVTLTR
jgi:glucosamine--fructose-6-phosphate aminotransferase (isomerizing)